jgi:hypothetical protein
MNLFATAQTDPVVGKSLRARKNVASFLRPPELLQARAVSRSLPRQATSFDT